MTQIVERDIPRGWYALGSVRGPTLERVRLAGEERLLWRHEGGASLLSSICPHLGADLAELGEVRDGELLCPFHGFRFDREGTCVATGYGTPPPGRAKLDARPVVTHHGLHFAWFDPEGGVPAFELPEVAQDGWSDPVVETLTLRATPQDITENSVDVGHFSWVHGYRDVEVVDPLRVRDDVLRTKYRFRRPLLGTRGTLQEIDLHVHGLGYSRVEVLQVETGARARLFVLPRPVDAHHVDLVLGMCLPASLPEFVRRPLSRQLLGIYVGDVKQDERFWANKRPITPPALARGDGPIGRYQAWARRFYGAVAA